MTPDIQNHLSQFPHAAIQLYENRLYGIWMIGNNYKRTANYYGSYPPLFLDRVYSLYPTATSILHLFSGSLPPNTPGTRLDIQGSPDIKANAKFLPFAPNSFDLVIADPPYSATDAKRYKTSNPSSATVMRELHPMCSKNATVIWLCTNPPLYRKTQWSLSGIIGLHVGTNKRFRAVIIMDKLDKKD